MDDTSQNPANDASQDFDVAKSEKAKSQPRINGRFTKKTDSDTLSDLKVKVTEDKKIPNKYKEDDPPLVDVKVTNPVTYFKRWWKKMIGNEGIEMKASLKIKPLTAFLLLAFVVSGGVTISLLNKVRERSPVADYIPAFGSENISERAFTGTITTSSKGTYFLITSEDLITLSSDSVAFKYFEDKKVLVSGKYDSSRKSLVVEDIKELSE